MNLNHYDSPPGGQINCIEVVDTLNCIIKLQSGIIDGLFHQLSQHITVEELDRLPEVEKINEAARLRHALRIEGPQAEFECELGKEGE